MAVVGCPPTEVKSVTYHGKMIDDHTFKFDCGFMVGEDVIRQIFGRMLNSGDQGKFVMSDVEVLPHRHNYRCMTCNSQCIHH